MQFHLVTLTALLAAATAQNGLVDSLTAGLGSAFESKASTALTGAAASYTGVGSGIVSSIVSSGLPSGLSSRLSTATAGTATSTGGLASSLSSAAAAATSTGAAGHNQVKQAGLGAVVAVGLLGVVV